MPELPGLVKGLGVTLRTMLKPAVTVQYPHEKETPTPRARGVIALKEDNCTVCMLCARECPDWCIYIEGHKYLAPPRREGGAPRQKNALDRFDIDYSLCMYCGICVEVCPFDALFWSPEYEYSESASPTCSTTRSARRVDADRSDHEAYEAGSEQKVKKIPMTAMLTLSPSISTWPRTSPSASSPW